MSKRIFELAKELNTTSKRLIEKLEEINIKVKSHMSLLEEDELDRLYKHIGIVNRNRVEGSDDAANADQPEQAENQIRRGIPRIIRKTEIIIHDDEYERDSRDKDKNKNKSKKSIVRTSSATDGLMAGLTRGNENVYTRKTPPEPAPKKEEPIVRKKVEEPKAPQNAVDDIISISPRGERIRRPMDNILSIKKVSSRDERLKQLEAEAKQDTVQTTVEKEPEKKEALTVIADKTDKTEKTDNRATTGTQKETVSAGAEKSEEHMTINTQVAQQAMNEKAVESKPAGTTVNEVVQKAADNETVKTAQPEVRATVQVKESKESDQAERKDANRNRSNMPEQRPQMSRDDRGPRAGQERDQHGRGPNRDGGQFGRDAAQNRPRDGGPNRGAGGPGGRGPAGEGGGFRRDGDARRDGGFNKDDRGFDRNRGESGGRGRSDDRGRGQGGSNRPLVIPKVTLAPGQVEEKNNLRGERRSAITRDLEKNFKKEAKKDASRTPIPPVVDKGKEKYKKSFVVGHKASVSDMYSDDFVLNEFYEERERLKKDKNKKKEEKHIPPKAVLQEITIPETITVKNLAEALKKTAAEVIKKLITLGVMATLNQELDFDTASIVGEEFGVKVHKEVVITDEDILFDDDTEDKEEELVERPPVVVVMGHVDHGKTSLLDAIRKTNVVESEAGGITQHIGAYKVNVNGRQITFLDTPGHEAFTAMRARGAQATDIAILVVAADDGVMPQTIEAINHAKAANVSMIVAINKIDKPGANPDRVKQELADRGVLIEEWGGDVIAVPISAKKGTNIDQLLEMVLLTADVLELKANPNRQAKGIIIEAKLDKGRGPVATVLVQRGTLHAGDSIISGTTFGRIRAMTDENGRKIEAAGPSTPAEIVGLDEVPEAGEVFYAVKDEKVAKHLVEQRRAQQREKAIGTAPRVSLDALFNQIQQGEVKELNIIIKADVQGSVEAVKQSVEKLSNDEVKVQVIHGGVGAINEADVTLASVSNAIIIGFNVRPPANVVEAAEAAGVDIRLYRIIYNAIEDIEKAMKGLLAPTFKEVVDGHVEIRQTFKASSVGTIGGGYVTDGKVARNSEVRVVRNGIVIYEGKLASLKRFKDDVREVAQGYECGILIDKFNDIKEGDVIEAFHMEEVQRT